MTARRYVPGVVPLVHQLRETAFMYDRLADLLAELLSTCPGQEVLSLGCGTGSLEWRLAERGYVVSGIDIDPAVVAFARELCSARGVDVRFEVGDMFLAAERSPVDAVVALYTEAPVDRLRVLLKRLVEAVKPGGLFVTNLATCPSDSVGSSTSFIDIFPEDAGAAACLSAYRRTLHGVRGNEVYLCGRPDGTLSMLSDFSDIPVEFQAKSAVSAGPWPWVPVGWRFRESVDLDAACPSAAPPFCQQALVVLQRTDDASTEVEA